MNTQDRILFYGDSNTYGYISDNARFSPKIRFPCVAASLLSSAIAIEEGLTGRLAARSHSLADDIILGGASFPRILDKSLPLSALVLMLGTNDLIPPFFRKIDGIVEDIRFIVRFARYRQRSLPILLLYPPPVAESWFCRRESKLSTKLKRISWPTIFDAYKSLAMEEKIDFLDEIKLSDFENLPDGLHMSAHTNKLLGKLVAKKLSIILSR